MAMQPAKAIMMEMNTKIFLFKPAIVTVKRRENVVQTMAESQTDHSTLFQLRDKETEDDIEYEASQSGNDGHVPMATKREVVAWWFYDFANSPTAGIGLAFLFPIFLTTC